MRVVFTDVDVAYAAGLFDGEGCVYIHRVKRARGKDGHRLGVQVANTDPRPCLWLKERFGGWIREVGPAVNRRRAFFWINSGPDGEDFLRLVQPHVIIKRDQVELALAFRALAGQRDVTDEREAMRQTLSEMKRVKFDSLKG